MGCDVVVFAEESGSVHARREVPLSRRPVLGPDAWPPFGERLTEVAEHLHAEGLRLAYHHHMGTVVQTEEEIDRLMEASGEAVGLLLDTGHLAYAGGDLPRVAGRHARRLAHVHCKDVRPAVLAEVRRDDRSFLGSVLAGVFTVPGDGAIDYGALLPILKSAAYSGWLVVEAEQDPAVAHPATYARLGFTHLSRAVAAARLGAGGAGPARNRGGFGQGRRRVGRLIEDAMIESPKIAAGARQGIVEELSWLADIHTDRLGSSQVRTLRGEASGCSGFLAKIRSSLNQSAQRPA
jgi:sugar phosphate isomerase/epimerase